MDGDLPDVSPGDILAGSLKHLGVNGSGHVTNMSIFGTYPKEPTEVRFQEDIQAVRVHWRENHKVSFVLKYVLVSIPKDSERFGRGRPCREPFPDTLKHMCCWGIQSKDLALENHCFVCFRVQVNSAQAK